MELAGRVLTHSSYPHAIDRRIQLPANLRDQLNEIENSANQKNESEPNFWSEVVPAECLLVRSLAAGGLDKNQADIVSRYLRAQTRGASSPGISFGSEAAGFSRKHPGESGQETTTGAADQGAQIDPAEAGTSG
jgi:hypothetical protein